MGKLTGRLTILIACAVGVLAGCNDVGFQSVPRITCDDVSRDQDSECVTKGDSITISFDFQVGDVEILFVDDNSGSMFVEQKKMADAFSNFLGSISDLFYRIAIITPDVTATAGNSVAKAANGHGAYQDGKFLEFTDESRNRSGLYVISPSTPNLSALFRGTIKRYETEYCEGSGFQTAHCPSDDERGIYALNLAVQRGSDKFFRTGSHLAVVILSDEDERSQGGRIPERPLETNDLPETFVKNMNKYYPTKSFSVHSIVTNDEACRLAQNQSSTSGLFMTRGYIGEQYMKLSNPTSDLMNLGLIKPGSVGSICSSNYAAQLSSISANIRRDTLNAPKQLACLPDPATMKITTTPNVSATINYQIDSLNRITFTGIPLGVKATFTYVCPKF